jgi:protein-S-isoprenylcysteine O-methyltransferase Ste14
MVKISEKFVSPLLMWMIVIIGIILLLKFVPALKLFKLGVIGDLIFVLTLLYWIYFFISAGYVHRKAALSAAKIDKIIKKGIYSHVRHPFYSADIIFAWGIFLFIPILNVLFSVIWATIIFFFWMKFEEKALIRKFGKEYEIYKKEVPMFIPSFKKHYILILI